MSSKPIDAISPASDAAQERLAEAFYPMPSDRVDAQAAAANDDDKSFPPGGSSIRRPLLDRIDIDATAIQSFTPSELKQVADEIRQELIDNVSQTGGHLGSNLSVVELTVGLHHVYQIPSDRLIWDVSHQTYPHKMLTGRRNRMRTIRQGGGISGYAKRSESKSDAFGAGHSSTSISAALGMAVGRDLKGATNHVVAVIGDGSMSAGMAYEAMNNAGATQSRLVVILNDNDMSIARPVGAFSEYLQILQSIRGYAAGTKAQRFLSRLMNNEPMAATRARTAATIAPNFFEDLGFRYVGPVDGHNLDKLVPVLKKVRDHKDPSPVLIHVVTNKGHGYAPAEASADKYHGVGKFDVVTGALAKPKANAPSYTAVFAEALINQAKRDDKVVAITAAMPAGTGLDKFAKAFPTRTFDVGIAEQHAVTFAAGLATEGFKPVCALYSTFLQRAYDQVVHDVSIQHLAVRFAIDRAGLVGADGATHAGSFDNSYLGCLPGMVLMSPSDEAELVHAVATSLAIEDGPSAFRYPRGEGVGVELPEFGTPWEIGKGRIIREGSKVAILSLGTRLSECLNAAEELSARGLSATVADARFAKPIDQDLIRQLVRHHALLVTVEEGSIGGFSSQVLHFLASDGLLDNGLKVLPMVLPDRYQDHDDPNKQYNEAGLNAAQIVAGVLASLG